MPYVDDFEATERGERGVTGGHSLMVVGGPGAARPEGEFVVENDSADDRFDRFGAGARRTPTPLSVGNG